MGLFDHFPYTNFHELNLTWLLEKVKELENIVNNFVALNTIKYADPIQWNITTQYEANTVVVDPQSGTAYISTKAVPTGVAISNTDYWSVIFTLDVISANKNLTLRDDGSNVLATFASNAGDWLLWNGTLYKVSQAINVNEAYVDGYNLNRYTVELYIQDLADLVGDLDDLTTSDKTSIVNAINSINSSISAIKLYVTPEMYGAVGDGVTDDTQAITDSLASGLPVWFKNTYYCDGVVSLSANVAGDDGQIINAFYRIEPNTTIKDIKIDCAALDSFMTSDNAVNVTIKNNDITGANGYRAQFLTNENILIMANNFNVTKYCIVTNDDHIKHLRVIGNYLKSSGDCVELNSPNVSDAKYNIIAANSMYNGDDTIAGTGFSVGIANGHQSSIVGNVSEKSMLQGVHIEADSTDIVAAGNVFDNCQQRGVHVLSGTQSDSCGIIIADNIINGNGAAGTAGATQLYTGSTSQGLPYQLLGNKISNFAKGIEQSGNQPVIADNNLIVDCPTGVEAFTEIIGTNYFKGTSKVALYDGARIENAVFLDDVSDISDMFNTAHCLINELSFHHVFNISSAATAFNAIPVFTGFNGFIEITVRCGNYYAILVIDQDGQTLHSYTYGGLVVLVTKSTNAITIDVHSSNLTASTRLAVHAKGSILI